MTIQQAIWTLIDCRRLLINGLVLVQAEEITEAFDMAIEALNNVMDSENDAVKTEDDVIKRQDAIKTVCRTRCGDKAKGCPAHSCPVIEEFDALPSAEAEWIPCSERLPNTNGIYIVTRRRSDGFECRNLTDACYFDGTSTWHDDTRVNHGRKYLTDVLAWMPLPEPYRGDGEL